MNEKAVEVLVRAGLEGHPQIHGAYYREGTGRCAIGELAHAAGILHNLVILPEVYELRREQIQCPLCGDMDDEFGLIVHLNDDHRLDFISIARKLGPDA